MSNSIKETDNIYNKEKIEEQKVEKEIESLISNENLQQDNVLVDKEILPRKEEFNNKNNKINIKSDILALKNNENMDSSNQNIELKEGENLDQKLNNFKEKKSIQISVHEEINRLLDENNALKIELNKYKSDNLELKYRELLLDYQNIQIQNNNLIEQNEFLKNQNDEIEKESINYKNKYNLILKEQKKTKNLLEEISLNIIQMYHFKMN